MLLQEGVASQSGLSNRAIVRVRGGIMRRRAALVSERTGYRRYPVEIFASLDASGVFQFEESVRVE
jgi:GTP cyclohydrolase IB